VGTMAVVVPDVAVEDAKEVQAAGDQEMVQAFPAHGANPPLGDGVGVRGLDRRANDDGTDRAPEVIEGPGELAVAVAEQEPEAGLLIKRAKEIPGLLGDPGAGGVGGDAGEMHTPGVQLDEEQHIQPVQEHGVHGEEVTGQDAGGLPAQERPPGGGSRSRRRLETVPAQDPGDGAGGDLAAEPQQLPADALVAPAWFSVASRTITVCTCWGTDGRPRPALDSSSAGASCADAIQAASRE
jgi:hypothetical protein